MRDVLAPFGTVYAVVLLLVAVALLGGCATTPEPEPRVIIQEKHTPVPVDCVPGNLGAAPAYPDTDEALRKTTPEGRYALVIAGRELRNQRLKEVEPVIEGCRQ